MKNTTKRMTCCLSEDVLIYEFNTGAKIYKPIYAGTNHPPPEHKPNGSNNGYLPKGVLNMKWKKSTPQHTMKNTCHMKDEKPFTDGFIRNHPEIITKTLTAITHNECIPYFTMSIGSILVISVDATSSPTKKGI